jgi:hypothetical protein
MLDDWVATAHDKFKALLADDFAPWLKQRGFKRRDSTFRRREDEAWQIVNFQRDKYSRARLVSFTINLGVSLDVLHEHPSWRARGWPLEHECDFRQRIGFLGKGEDYWWKVRPLLPRRAITSDVLDALEMALPWLDERSDPRSLLTDALRDPSRETFGLWALVELAKKVGTPAEVGIAEAELRRWQTGDRKVW